MPKTQTYRQRNHRIEVLAEHSHAFRRLRENFPDVLTVSDAERERVLLVTEADVKNGQPRNGAECAVAQCAKRQGIGGLIGREYAYLIEGRHATRYRMTKTAQIQTAVFDVSGTTSAGPVLLSTPSPSLRLGRVQRAVHVSKAARARRKPKTAITRGAAKRDEKRRQAAITHGFRTWSTAVRRKAG